MRLTPHAAEAFGACHTAGKHAAFGAPGGVTGGAAPAFGPVYLDTTNPVQDYSDNVPAETQEWVASMGRPNLVPVKNKWVQFWQADENGSYQLSKVGKYKEFTKIRNGGGFSYSFTLPSGVDYDVSDSPPLVFRKIPLLGATALENVLIANIAAIEAKKAIDQMPQVSVLAQEMTNAFQTFINKTPAESAILPLKQDYVQLLIKKGKLLALQDIYDQLGKQEDDTDNIEKIKKALVAIETQKNELESNSKKEVYEDALS